MSAKDADNDNLGFLPSDLDGLSEDRYFPRSAEWKRKELERELRETDPAVKDAWEQYQVVLALRMPDVDNTKSEAERARLRAVLGIV